MADLIIPNHIAIIPDGNRRWAKAHHVPSIAGHKKGLEVGLKIAKKIRALGIHTLTVWAFSTENWQRDEQEVRYLMKLYEQFVDSHIRSLAGEGVKVRFLGRRDRLPKTLREKIGKIEYETDHFSEFVLNIALDYGGRDEITRAVQDIASMVANNTLNPKDITQETITQALDTANEPYQDPDIIIRTSGEKRISGLMPWQAVYAELFFVEKYFPELEEADIEQIVTEYSHRQRRFGS